ncbi:MAG: hypothetical protein C9356_16325 [Oleiphilus sp.]|nr:MAG: hypothetical protein C9356_16325 [Oleiphilus sp.]
MQWLFELKLMTTPNAEQFLSAGEYLAVVRDFALSKGISPAQLLEGSQIQWQDLIHPPELVNNLIVNKVGINLFAYLENPVADATEFGLRMTAASHGALGLAVQYANNLDEAYDILKHFYNTRINSQDVRIQETSGDIRVFLENKFVDEEVGPAVQQFFDLATLVSIATNTFHALDMTGLRGQIRLLINTPEPRFFPHASLEGIKTLFEQETMELRLPVAWKSAPLRAANPAVVEAALETCEQELQRIAPNDWLEQVKQFLLRELSTMPSLNDIAAQFYMSPATFKRRLAEYGVSY